MIGRVEHVWFWVSDMERAIAYYTSALELPLLQRHGDEWAELNAGSVRLALHRGEGRPPGGTVVFEVEDLDAARFAMELRGTVFDERVGEADGLARFVSFTDPDGNRMQLLERYGEH